MDADLEQPVVQPGHLGAGAGGAGGSQPQFHVAAEYCPLQRGSRL